MDSIGIAGFGAISLAIASIIAVAMLLRVVVSTNDVHIVQSTKRTVSYGKGQEAGNTYYAWPAAIPMIGVKVISLPVSVFDLSLNNYAGYDKGRVPFQIDIMAFFRIDDSSMAAQRVHSFEEMRKQLEGILQGATRSVLATAEINDILERRAEYGEQFTTAVSTQLKEWGVCNVKNIELMDIRDAAGSEVIANIMAKKKSQIERESRETVADNIRAAQEAEIAAEQQVLVREQQSKQAVGTRTAEAEREVGIAHQTALQAIKEQEAITATRTMQVLQVETVRQAEITKDAQVVLAEQQKRTTVVVAEGALEQAKLHAEGVRVEGVADGDAKKAVLLAPVEAQIRLATEIGTNDKYQTYLISVRTIEANQAVGIAQAEAIKAADIKVIANAGDVSSGVQNVMQLLTPKGGTAMAGAVEAFAQSEVGQRIIAAALGPKDEKA